MTFELCNDVLVIHKDGIGCGIISPYFGVRFWNTVRLSPNDLCIIAKKIEEVNKFDLKTCAT